DSEDEGELFIGCAGGVDSLADFTYRPVTVPEGYYFARITVKGLLGGHSGGDIHLGRGNANKLLARFLLGAFKKYDLYVIEIDGGNLRNAIPREATAVVALPESDRHALRSDLNVYAATIEGELGTVEPYLQCTLESETPKGEAIDKDTTRRLLQTLYALPHGVHAMSHEIPGLVETSTNLASVKMRAGHIIHIETSQRSSIDSARQDMAQTVRTVMEMGGATVSFSDGYPGWKPNPHSEILQVATEAYRRLFGTEAEVKAIHAGLECGLFLDKYPSLDMISFGPTLRGVHSPDEQMHIPSVERFWKHLTDILLHAPEKE
ncbi:MAG: M20/M25/M40 family metallo-hydrolase, partial [Prevotellaceae bacterium]|nr:M20/M25/M40 family metallo-hydrolase [Prevotellaceae bacterium]